MKLCIICNLEKPKHQFGKWSRKCSECHHLTKCCSCNEIKESSEFRPSEPNRCKKCSNKQNNIRKKINQITSYKAKLDRVNIRKRVKECKRPKLSKEESYNIRRLRGSLHKMFKKWCVYKIGSSLSYLTYTKEEFLAKFPEIGVSMHLDHKIPISWFKPETPISVIFHLDNLQLLSEEDNLKKNNLYHHPVTEEFLLLCRPFIREEYLNKFIK